MSKVNELAVQAMSGFWFIILVNKVFPDLGNAIKKNNLRFWFFMLGNLFFLFVTTF